MWSVGTFRVVRKETTRTSTDVTSQAGHIAGVVSNYKETVEG